MGIWTPDLSGIWMVFLSIFSLRLKLSSLFQHIPIANVIKTIYTIYSHPKSSESQYLGKLDWDQACFTLVFDMIYQKLCIKNCSVQPFCSVGRTNWFLVNCWSERNLTFNQTFLLLCHLPFLAGILLVFSTLKSNISWGLTPSTKLIKYFFFLFYMLP